MMKLHPQRANVHSVEDQLTELSSQIAAADQTVQESLKNGALAALRAGRLLCRAKELTKHGDWLTWLANHTPLKDRTAQLYMRFYRWAEAIGEDEVAQRVTDLSFRSAMSMLTMGTDHQVVAVNSAPSGENRSELPPNSKAIRASFLGLKRTIKPLFDGEAIDPTSRKEAIRALLELISLLKDSEASSLDTNIEPDDLKDSE